MIYLAIRSQEISPKETANWSLDVYVCIPFHSCGNFTEQLIKSELVIITDEVDPAPYISCWFKRVYAQALFFLQSR